MNRLVSHLVFLLLFVACGGDADPGPSLVPVFSPTREPVAVPGGLPSATPEFVPALPPLATLEVHTFESDEFVSYDVLLLMEEGGVLFGGGRYLDAIAKYEEAEEKHGSRLVAAQNWMGLAQLNLENYDLAAQHFTNEMEVLDSSNARSNRAIAYRNANMCAEAVDDAWVALGMEPIVAEGWHTHAEAHLVLADCLVRTGDYSLALEHLDSAIALAAAHGFSDGRVDDYSRMQSSISDIADGSVYPEDFFSGPALADYESGYTYFEQGLYEQAIGSFESAVERYWTDSGWLFHLLGVSYGGLGLHQEAMRYFDRGIEVSGDGYNRAWRACGYLYFLNDCGMALFDAEAALGHPPLVRDGFNSYSGALLVRGQCLGYNGNLDGALTDVEEAIRLARESGGSFRDIALIEELYQSLLDEKASQGSPAP